MKRSIWFQRGFDAADRDEYLDGVSSCKLEAMRCGNFHDVQLSRYPKKMAEFEKGYWAGIAAQCKECGGKMTKEQFNDFTRRVGGSKCS